MQGNPTTEHLVAFLTMMHTFFNHLGSPEVSNPLRKLLAIHVEAYITFLKLTFSRHYKESLTKTFDGCIKHAIDPTVFRRIFSLYVDLDKAKNIVAGDAASTSMLGLLPAEALPAVFAQVSAIFHQSRIAEGSLFDTLSPYFDTLVGYYSSVFFSFPSSSFLSVF